MNPVKHTFSSMLLFLFSCNASNQTIAQEEKIVFKDSLGHSLTKADLANVTGSVNYEIISNKPVDPKAKALHNEARELGQSGKYDLVIAKLKEAMKIEPTWPYPTYDLGYTYLLMGDYENALKFYKKTDELAPKGFFTSKTDLYIVEGELSGKFPKGMYINYMQIEWTYDVNEKIEIAKAITRDVPDFAPAWKELGILLNDNREKLEAIEQGLSKNPDAATKGVLLVNKAMVLNEDGKKEEAKKILGNLIFSPDATTDAIEMAKFTLKTIAEK